MPTVVRCAACGKSFPVRDDFAGQEAPCPVCGKPACIEGGSAAPYDVFISHSTRDKTIADAAVAALEARGVRCWVAPRDILPGREWGEAILDAINQSRVMVLIFSAHADHSQQVLREVERAVHRGIPLVPFRIENVLPSRAMEYYISTSHWLDGYRPPLEQRLDELTAAARALLAGEAAPSREGPKDLKALSKAAVRTLLARDNRVRVLAGLAALLLLIGGAVVGSLYALREPKASDEMIQAKANAEVLADGLKTIDGGQGVAGKVQQVADALKAGQGFADQKQFPKAQVEFQKVLTQGPALMVADRQRKEAQGLRPEVEKARQGAADAWAEQYASAALAGADQKFSEGRRAYDGGDFGVALAAFREAASQYRETRRAARQGGKPRLKALAFCIGFSGNALGVASGFHEAAVRYQDSVKDDHGTYLSTLMWTHDLAETQAKRLREVREVCEPQFNLKDDLVGRLCETRDLETRKDILSQMVPAVSNAYGEEVGNGYCLGMCLAYALYGCKSLGGLDSQERQKTLRICRQKAYGAGCPVEITDAITGALAKTDSGCVAPAYSVKENQCYMQCFMLLNGAIVKYLKDPDTATETFRKPRALPPLPQDQQEAVRALSQLGGDFDFDLDSLQPVAVQFPIDSQPSDRVMPYLQRLPSLTMMVLRSQNVTDEDLAALKSLSKLKALNLADTRVTEAGLKPLETLTDLEGLSLAGLPVGDQVLQHLTGLKKLKTLRLEKTQVTPAGIDSLKKALPDLEVKR